MSSNTDIDTFAAEGQIFLSLLFLLVDCHFRLLIWQKVACKYCLFFHTLLRFWVWKMWDNIYFRSCALTLVRNEPSQSSVTWPLAKWPGDTWAKPCGNLCFLLQRILLSAAGKLTLAVLQTTFCDVLLDITCVTHAAVVPRTSQRGTSFKRDFVKSLFLPSQVLAIPIFISGLLSLLLQWWHWLPRK